MRWSYIILGSTILPLSSYVLALPVDRTALERRNPAKDTTRQSSATVRKNALLRSEHSDDIKGC